MSWGQYVTDHSDGEINRVVAERIGVTEPNVSRWKRTDQVPRPQTVAAFARTYGRPVLEAFVAAGFLTAEEAKARPSQAPTLDSLTDEQLLDEVRERMRRDGTAITRGGGSPPEDPPAPGVTPLRRGDPEPPTQEEIDAGEVAADSDREGDT